MLTASEVAAQTRGFSDFHKAALRRRLWQQVGRPEQRLPPGDWPTFLCRGGRGSGKTRTGAEGLADLIFTHWEGDGDWAVIGPTFADARDTCMEGTSGLLRTLVGLYDDRKWNRSHGQLILRNGATVFCDGANDGALRIQGKNLRGAWCDEVGLWRRGRAGVQGREHQEWWEIAWDESLAFAVRIEPAQIIATGTPKRGHPLVKRLLSDPRVPSVRLKMIDNIANLARHRVEDLMAKYEGTALEAQELEGEYLEEVEGALWTDLLIAEDRWQSEWGEPQLLKTYVGVDPSGGQAEVGIVAAGQIRGRCPCGNRPELPHYAVIEDCSTKGTPEHWANAVHVCAEKVDADAVLGERNYGGDMVESTIRAAAKNDRHPYEDVNASKAKILRAEPISRIYEQHRVHHVGTFDLLEGEMTTYIPGGPSPNRLDALVWSMTKLTERAEGRGKAGRSTYVGRLPEGVA